MCKLCRRILTNLIPYHLRTAHHIVESEEEYLSQRIKILNKRNAEVTHRE
jgi:adenine C2-methylase RlmN of 23S rRNA A2503 and tRNA A37